METVQGDCFLDYLTFTQAWRLMLTAPNCIKAFSFLPSGFLPFNLREGAGQTSQLTNLSFLEKHNSGSLTWFEQNITKEEEYASAM